MEITTGDILTGVSMLGGAISLIWAFTRKTEKNDLRLEHEVEELKATVSENSKRLSLLETAYQDKRVEDAKLYAKIEHIDKNLNDVVLKILTLVENQQKHGGL